MSSFVEKINVRYGKYFLLGIDFAFIAASIWRAQLGLGGGEDLFDIAKDRGYAEQFQYIQLGGVILLLALLAARVKSAFIGGWAVIFSILLIDDRVSIHERGGAYIAEWFSFQPLFRLRAVDYGEIAVFALWGLISLAILFIANSIDQSNIGRKVSKTLFLSLLGFAFFGAFFDMLHIIAINVYTLSPMQNNIFDAIEDGGEMVVISLVLWFVYRTFIKALHDRQSLE